MARCYDHGSARTTENGAIVKKKCTTIEACNITKEKTICLIHFSYQDKVINIFREIS
jgi:hypothetical protein